MVTNTFISGIQTSIVTVKTSLFEAENDIIYTIHKLIRDEYRSKDIIGIFKRVLSSENNGVKTFANHSKNSFR